MEGMPKNCICVVIEEMKRNKELSYQLLTKARELADGLNYQVVFVSTGIAEEGELELLCGYGADTVCHCTLETEDIQQLANLIESILIQIRNKKLIMFASTRKGQAIAAILSIRFGVGLIAEAVGIKYENGFVYTRAAMNAMVMAEIRVKNSIFGMCTIKENAFNKKINNINCNNNIIYYKHQDTKEDLLSREDIIIKSIKKISKDRFTIKNGRIIFGCGRGVLTSGCFELFLQVVEKYKAEIACTRPVVEQGVIDFENQVGQSGKNIAPNIYIAFGISGASQHIAGIMNSSIIIAVNNDEHAPIFQFANYKLVADVKEVLVGLLQFNDKF